jgi:hypothetical protein
MSFIMLKFTALAVSLMSGAYVKDQCHKNNEDLLSDKNLQPSSSHIEDLTV